MAEKTYELASEELNVPTNKPNEPFTFKTYRKGDKVKMDETRGAELVAVGAFVDPDAEKAEDGKPGQSKAPGEKAGKQDPAGSGATPPPSGSTQGVQTPKA